MGLCSSSASLLQLLVILHRSMFALDAHIIQRSKFLAGLCYPAVVPCMFTPQAARGATSRNIDIAIQLEEDLVFQISQPFGTTASPTSTTEEEDDGIDGGDRQGTYVWPASVDLAKYLTSRSGRDLIEGRQVVELGAGTGVAGLAASVSGAEGVMLTDGSKECLEVTRETVRRNEPILQKYRGGGATAIAVERLRWANSKDITNVVNEMNGGVDVVLGAEITYLVDSLDPLFETMRKLLLTSSSRTHRTSPTSKKVKPPLGLITYTPELTAFDGNTGTDMSKKYPKGESALTVAAERNGLRIEKLAPQPNNPDPDTNIIAVLLEN